MVRAQCARPLGREMRQGSLRPVRRVQRAAGVHPQSAHETQAAVAAGHENLQLAVFLLQQQDRGRGPDFPSVFFVSIGWKIPSSPLPSGGAAACLA